MILEPKNNNRLCIYCCYDRQGVVDEYVMVMLRALKPFVKELLVVSNGQIIPEGKTALKQLGCALLERPNQGFDTMAYKAGLEYYGAVNLSAFDEIIMMNATVAGPVFPLDEMFSAMEAKDLDFWGISMHHAENYDPWGLTPNGVLPEHIMTFFLAVRKPLFTSTAFKEYWDNLPPIHRYEEAVSYHEVVFTKYFEEKGFSWDTYIQTQDLDPLTGHAIITQPAKMITQKRCPVFKRRSLYFPMEETIHTSYGETTQDLLFALEKAMFNLRPILTNLLRTESLSQISSALAAYSVAAETRHITNKQENTSISPLIMIHIQDAFLSDLCKGYLPALLEFAKVILVTSVPAIEEEYRSLYPDKLQFLPARDFFTLLDYLEQETTSYSWVGFMGFFNPAASGGRCLPQLELHKLSMESLVKNKYLVQNHLANPLIQHSGLLIPPLPLHQPFTTLTQNRWKQLFPVINTMLQALQLNLAVSAEEPFPSPIGGCFWLRKESIAALPFAEIKKHLSSLSNPEEIFYHALPLLVQSTGYLTVQVTGTNTLPPYINSLFYLWNKHQSTPSPLLDENKILKGTLFWDEGAGFTESASQTVRLSHTSSTIRLTYEIQHPATQLRFDPVEGFGLICHNATATKNGQPVNLFPWTGWRFGNTDIFLTDDPVYVAPCPFEKGDKVEIFLDQPKKIQPSHFQPEINGTPNPQFGGALTEALAKINTTFQEQKAEIQQLQSQLAEQNNQLAELKTAKNKPRGLFGRNR